MRKTKTVVNNDSNNSNSSGVDNNNSNVVTGRVTSGGGGGRGSDGFFIASVILVLAVTVVAMANKNIELNRAVEDLIKLRAEEAAIDSKLNSWGSTYGKTLKEMIGVVKSNGNNDYGKRTANNKEEERNTNEKQPN
jgi:predicted RNase H-related nuclease YkuK (DUF458 family)